MTELARLIGQSDPFAADPARAPRATPAAQPPGDWRDPRGRDARPGYDDYIAPPDPRDLPPEPPAQHVAPAPYRQGDEPLPRANEPEYGDFSYNDPRYNDPRYNDPRYGEPRYNEPRRDEVRYGDPHYSDPRYGDPRQGEPRYAEPRYGDPPAFGASGYPDPRYDDPGARDPHYPEDRPFPADGRGYDQTGLHEPGLHEPGLHESGRLGAAERSYAVGSYDDDYDRPQGPDRHDDEDYDERRPPRRRGLATVITIFVLLVVGAAGAFGYRLMFGGAPGPAPVIRADGAPNKVVPATQSPDASANKQIYDRLADRNQNERIVPREEQPVDIRDTTRQAAPRMVVPPSGAPGTGGPAPTPPMVPPQQQTAAFAPASVPTQEPRKVRTVTIRPDQGGDAAARGAARPGGRPGAQGRASGDGPLSLTPEGVSAPAPAAPVPSPLPARSAAVAAPPPPPPAMPAAAAASGGWVVQVSAQNSEQEAQAAFRSMQAKYPNQLGGQQPLIRRKDLASGVKYGAQVGPYGSREEAVRLCDELKSAGGACFVAKN